MNIPLTPSDLRDLAKTLDRVRRTFGEEDTVTKFGELFYQIRLEVLRPGGEDVIGTISYEDGWLGFTPKGDPS